MSADQNTGFRVTYGVKESPEMGLGVFACETIKQGTIVWRHIPSRLVVHDERSFKAAIKDMTHDQIVYELTHSFGLADLPGCVISISDEGALINHSSDANVATNNFGPLETQLDVSSASYLQDVTNLLMSDRYALIATRDIERGEEFTNNYGDEVSDPPFFTAMYELYDIDDDFLDSN